MERAKHIAFTLSLFIGLIFIGAVINGDTWFLLNCGRYVEAYGVPHTEPFTMHAGLHYVMQQWLFALGLWKVYSFAGTAGLVAFAWIAGAVILFLFERLVRLTAGGNRMAAFVIAAPVGVFLGLAFFCQRPQMASTAIFLVEIYLLERYKKKLKRPRWLYAAFPVLSALLVNVHAAMWPIMLIFLLPYACEALCGRRFAAVLPHDADWRLRELLLLCMLVVAAGCLGPNGAEGVTYSVRVFGDSDVGAVVAEMAPLSFGTGLGTGRLALILLFALTAVYARHPVPLRHLLLAGGTAFMALLSIRSLFLCLLFATFPLGRCLASWCPLQPTWTRRRRRVCALLLCGNILLFAHVLAPRYVQPPVPPSLAVAAGELARLAAAEGRAPHDVSLYTGFINGGYLEFCGFRCYMDGRAEVFLPALNHDRNVFHEYVDLQNGRTAYEDALAPYAFDALAVDRGDLLYAALAHDDAYTCIWDSETAGIAGEGMRIYRKK